MGKGKREYKIKKVEKYRILNKNNINYFLIVIIVILLVVIISLLLFYNTAIRSSGGDVIVSLG